MMRSDLNFFEKVWEKFFTYLIKLFQRGGNFVMEVIDYLMSFLDSKRKDSISEFVKRRSKLELKERLELNFILNRINEGIESYYERNMIGFDRKFLNLREDNQMKGFYEIIRPIISRDPKFNDYADFSQSYKGQVKIFENAKKGDISAINFIIFKSLDKIGSVFYNNFFKFKKDKNLKTDQKDFINVVYSLLLSREGEVNPLKTFDPKKFSQSTDLIEKFGYYLIGYLKNEVEKYLTKEKKRGITGNLSSKALKDIQYSKSINSYSTFDDEDSDSGIDIPDSSGSPSYFETLSSFKNFLKDNEVNKLKNNKYSLKDILKNLFKKNFKNLSDLGNYLGLSETRVHNLLKELGEALKKYDITKEDLNFLLTRRNEVLNYF